MVDIPSTLPDLRVLRQFVAVAESGSFRRAADMLHMSQPPLSVAMHKLEAQLDVRLFERSPAGISLTEAGAVLLKEATLLLAQARRAVELTQATARGELGEVRIAFITSAMVSFLPEVLGRYSAEYPDVRLRLVEGVSVEVAGLVSSGRADVGLLSPPVELAAGVAGETVLVDRLCAVLPDDHPLASRRSIPLAALARERFVSYSADRVPAFHQRIVGACIEAGFQPNIVQEAAHIYTIMALVAGRLGVALIPGSAAASGHRGVVRVPIAGNSRLLETRIDVVHPRSGASAAVANFLSHCRRSSEASLL